MNEGVFELVWSHRVPGAQRRGGEWVVTWRGTAIMGILNVTPDSFSDGWLESGFDATVAQGRRAWREGALIVDVGGESTRPGASPVSSEEERRRILPVIEALAANGEGLVSVDTRHADVAKDALAAGAHLVNDVTGLRDPAMRAVIAAAGVPAVLMHMQGEPATMQDAPRYRDVVGEVETFLLERAREAQETGIRSLVLDAGWGYGKRDEDNIALLAATPRLCAHGFPVLVGASRKGTLGRLTGETVAARRDPASLVVHAEAARLGAAIVRVHDVGAHAQALAMSRALGRQTPGPRDDHVRLHGLTFHGYHGVFEEEQRRGARFVVDVRLAFTFPLADDLRATANYAAVQDGVRIEVEERRYDLIETLAQRIAERLLDSFAVVREVEVTVHKPDAPLPGVFEDVTARVTRQR